jgi:hypothetical protein
MTRYSTIDNSHSHIFQDNIVVVYDFGNFIISIIKPLTMYLISYLSKGLNFDCSPVFSSAISDAKISNWPVFFQALSLE